IGLTNPSVIHKIKTLNLDIIHTQTEFSIGLTGRLMAKLLKIPVVHTYHTMYEDYTHYLAKRPLNQKIVTELAKVGSKLYLNECHAVIAPSEKAKDLLLGYKVHSKIYTIPTGIKLDNFKNDFFTPSEIQHKKTELGIEPQEKVLLSLGRVAEEKSIDVIIQAVKKLIHHSSLKLLIVGDGPYKIALEKMVKELNLENVVIFAGRIPWEKVCLYYQLADIYVSASKTETQGLTILEAMATGIPVVVRQDENIKDWIQDGHNGKVFNQISELPDILSRLLENEPLRQKISINGMETAQNMSATGFGNKVEEIYKKVVS
ncbi:MAG: glycosyltransferase, partial [Peptostreptococcales bacterium]